MHLLYISSPGGGLDTNVRVLAPALVKAGHRVSVLYLHSKGEVAPAAVDGSDGLEIYHSTVGDWHYYARRATFGLTSLPLFIRGLEYTQALASAISTIHSETPVDLIEVPEVFLTRSLSVHVPYIVRLHCAAWSCRRLMGEPSPLSDVLEARMEGYTLHHAIGISSPSKALADYIRANCGLGDQRIEIIPYPVDTAQFTPGSVRPGQPMVLFVGRVERRKGAGVLLRAIPLVLAKHPECEFVFAGSVANDLRAEAEKLPPAVKFLGMLPHGELIGWYQRASVCVVPSVWDNSPNVIYEAMACGTPVVASRVGGIPELVDDGITGSLVPPRDEKALADAIINLLDNTALRDRMGQRGREKAVGEYRSERILAKTLDLYDRALA
jgi:glycosyltransferase involved in cell wall biosynthesis